jgi:hypothetical protein
VRGNRRSVLDHGVGEALASSLDEDAAPPSTLVALITYVTVTVEPTLSSADPLIVAGSIANSYFSVPFWIASVVPVAATTVPVISYVLPPAANNCAFSAKLIAAVKQIIFRFIIGR